MDDYASILTTIAVASWLSLVTPGPNFVFVTEAAIRRSRLYGLAAGFGITAGSLVWCLVVIFGLDAAFKDFPWLSPSLRIAGSLYLIYLGIKLWRSAGKVAAEAAHAAPAGKLHSAFGRGVLISLTNPAAIAYYAGIFSSLLQPDDPTWVLVAAVVLICASSIVWNTALSLCFSIPRVQKAYARWDRPITVVAAVFMLAFGVRIAISAT